MYRLSSYTQFKEVGSQEFLINERSGEKVGWGPKSKRVLQEILSQSVFDGSAERQQFLSALQSELSIRGLIVPISTVAEEDEIFLQTPFKQPREGFFHLPTARYQALPDPTNLIIAGLPLDFGSSKGGARLGPESLRQRSWNFHHRSKGPQGLYGLSRKDQDLLANVQAFDLGDFKGQNLSLSDQLSQIEKVFSKLPAPSTVFGLGGDHVYSLPLISAAHRRRPIQKIIHLDSHLDLDCSISDTHDLPAHSTFMTHVLRRLPEASWVQFGAREFQSGRRPSDLDRGHIFSDLKLLTSQPSEIEEAVGNQQSVYLTIDVDVLPSFMMRDTGYPAALGISFAQILEIIRLTIRSNDVVGIDLMEFSGSVGGSGTSADLLVYLIAFIFSELREKAQQRGPQKC